MPFGRLLLLPAQHLEEALDSAYSQTMRARL